MWHDFVQLTSTLTQEKSNALLHLNPSQTRLPLPVTRFDDPLLPFSRAIIEATQDLVAGYVFDLAAYLAWGAAGARALERSIAVVGVRSVRILHGPFFGTAYSPAADKTAFAVDAITLVRSEDMSHYVNNAPYAAFALDSSPVSGGGYTADLRRFSVHSDGVSMVEMRCLGAEVMQRGMFDDYASQIRTAVEEAIR